MKKSKTLHALPKQSLLAHCEARDLDFEDNSGLRSVTPCHTCWDNSIRFHRTSPSLTRAMYLFQTWFDFRSAWDADRKCYESAWNGKLTGTDAICRRDKAQNGVWTVFCWLQGVLSFRWSRRMTLWGCELDLTLDENARIRCRGTTQRKAHSFAAQPYLLLCFLYVVQKCFAYKYFQKATRSNSGRHVCVIVAITSEDRWQEIAKKNKTIAYSVSSSFILARHD